MMPLDRRATHEHGGPQERRDGATAAAQPRDGVTGAAVAKPRDAYRDVPLLARPTWSHEITAYFFLGGVSSGSFALGSLAMLCGGPHWLRLGRAAHVVAFATMLPCAPLLIGDLGRPERFHHMLRIFKPSSPMNLGAWVLTAHGAFSALAAAGALARAGKLPVAGALFAALPAEAVAAAGIPTALALGGYTGVLLGTTSVPVWFTSPLLGALFMASSLSTGAAALSLTAAVLTPGDKAAEGLLSTLGAQLGTADLALLGGYLVTSGKAAAPLLRGARSRELAGSVAAIGAGVALDLLAAVAGKKGRGIALLAAGAKLLGGALLRTAVVGAGGHSAEDREGTLAAMSPSKKAPGWGP